LLPNPLLEDGYGCVVLSVLVGPDQPFISIPIANLNYQITTLHANQVIGSEEVVDEKKMLQLNQLQQNPHDSKI
jgi:hypothetical protein